MPGKLLDWMKEKGHQEKSARLAEIAVVFDVLNGGQGRLQDRIKALEDARSADVDKRAELIGEIAFLKAENAELKRLRGVDKATLNEHDRRIDGNKAHTQKLEGKVDKLRGESA